ncbi:MAG: histidinol dehydrogenase, partial [Methanomassiliicoccaceae archaeon]|nr:histidinol dehydrogenase [Methanomassiliicoccaceae archaeon]
MWKQLDEGFWEKNRVSKVDSVAKDVLKIIEQVRTGGDKALIELTKRFDRVDIDSVLVSRDEIDDAYDEVDEELIDALESAAANIQRFHEMQLDADLKLTEMSPGVFLGVK